MIEVNCLQFLNIEDIDFTLLVSNKSEKFIDFKRTHLSNISFILVTSEVLKLDKSILVNLSHSENREDISVTLEVSNLDK